MLDDGRRARRLAAEIHQPLAMDGRLVVHRSTSTSQLGRFPDPGASESNTQVR